MMNITNTRLTMITGSVLALAVLVGCQRADSSASDAVTPEAASVVKTGEYSIDPAHTEIGFRVKHLGISTVRGVFNEADAAITFPSDDLADLQTSATVQAASIYTNDADRDGHLRSADFFDVENHPVISFASTEVTGIDGSRFTLNGDLTIRGVTKPIVLSGEYLGTAVDPWGSERTAFTAEGAINRKDFGLNWNKALEAGGLLVGDEVTIVLDVQAVKDGQ